MERYLYIYFPKWCLRYTHKLHKLPYDKPSVLVERSANRDLVRQCSVLAQHKGVFPGMTLAHAQACVRDLLVFEHRPAESLRPLKTFCQALHQFTPLVALDPVLAKGFQNNTLHTISEEHVGIILDLRGTDKLYKKIEHVTDRVLQYFSSQSCTVKIGASSTFAMAWALAHYGSAPITIQNTPLKDTAKKLPVSALRIDQKSSESLNYYGIYTIAELLPIRRKELAKRFSLLLVERLQQLLGESEQALHYILPKKRTYTHRVLAHPLEELLPLTRAISTITGSLHNKLSEQGLRAQFYQCNLFCDDRLIHKKKFSLYRTHYSLRTLEHLVYQLFERLVIKEKISSISIEAIHIRSLSKEQSLLNGKTETWKIDYKEFLQRVTSIISKSQIYFIARNSHHQIERSYRFSNSYSDQNNEGFCHQQCPTTLLYPPQEVKAIALLPEHAPVRLFWNHFEYVVTQGFGPEKISETWWRSNSRHNSRDYFKLQTHTGIWLWVFRSMPEQRWFLHGFWS